jgi:hypothetical protein
MIKTVLQDAFFPAGMIALKMQIAFTYLSIWVLKLKRVEFCSFAHTIFFIFTHSKKVNGKKLKVPATYFALAVFLFALKEHSFYVFGGNVPL